MSGAVSRVEQHAVTEQTAVINMIERVARDPSVDIGRLERLIELQQRMIADRARVEYMAALALLQPELPAIEKRGRIDIGRGKAQAYALWEDINEGIKPILAKYGFVLSFRIAHTDDTIQVTAVLGHRGGHHELTTTPPLPHDKSGSKNAVQAVGSSIAYGKRYSACALLNITTMEEDDDGVAAGAGPAISAEQAETIKQRTSDYSSEKMQRFLGYIRCKSIESIPADKYDAVIRVIDDHAARAQAAAGEMPGQEVA